MTVAHPDRGAEQNSNVVQVNRGMSLESSQERGVAIAEREYNRLIERLEGCKSTGLADVWLAGGGLGGGLAAAALVTALSLGTSATGSTMDILWMLAILGAVIASLSLGAYFSQRHERNKEINELKTDMEIHRTTTPTAEEVNIGRVRI